MKQPLMHMFKTPGSFYLYDAKINTILELSESLYSILDKTNLDDNFLENAKLYSREDYNIIEKMLREGFLSNNSIKNVCHYEDDSLEYNLSRKLWMMTIQVTQQCNLRCEYCVYSGGYENRNHTNRKMTFDMAKKCIDFLIKNSIDSDKIAVGFYGGEPLLEFNLIKKCIEYTEEKVDGKEILFALTTNATLLNSDIIEYFAKHNIGITISLDGPAEIHNMNRKFANGGHGSFNKVIENLERIKKEYPDYFNKISISAVLDPKSDFSCTNSFFTNFDTIKEAMTSVSLVNTEYSKKTIKEDEDFFIKLNYEYFKFYLSKLGRLDEKYTSKLVRQHYQTTQQMYEKLKPSYGLREKMHPSGPCVPGVTRLFVNVDGNIYPCERVSESSEVMKIGHIDVGFDIEKVRRLLNIGRVTEENCKNCWSFRFCTLCAQSADNITELSAERRLSHCQAVKDSVDNNMKDICMLKEKGIDFYSIDADFSK